MSDIIVVSKNQRLIIDPPSRTVSVHEVGPMGPPGASYGKRNRFINGGFDIWQRGAGPHVRGSLNGTADNWIGRADGSSVSVTREPFLATPAGLYNHNPQFFLRGVVTSVVGAGNRASIAQHIEDVTTFAGQTVTFSFWAKADAPKNVSVELYQSFGTGGAPSAPVSAIGVLKIPITTTWTRYSQTITVPSVYGKTFGTTHNGALLCVVWLDAGSNFDSRTNSLGHQAGTFDFWGMQIEAGSVATPFEAIPYQDELFACQRYYVRFSGTSESIYAPLGFGQQATTTNSRVFVALPRPFRFMTPSFSVTGPTEIIRGASTTPAAVSAVNILGNSSRLGQLAFSIDHAALPVSNEAVTWRLANSFTAFLEIYQEAH